MGRRVKDAMLWQVQTGVSSVKALTHSPSGEGSHGGIPYDNALFACRARRIRPPSRAQNGLSWHEHHPRRSCWIFMGAHRHWAPPFSSRVRHRIAN